MKKIFIAVLCLIPYTLFSQVELISIDASKFYPKGTQITYLNLSDYPIEVEFLNFVNSNIINDTRIHRFSLYKDGKTCFFEADTDVSEDIVVEAINEAYRHYYSQPKEIRENTLVNNNVNKKNTSSSKNNIVRTKDNYNVSPEKVNKTVDKLIVQDSNLHEDSSNRSFVKSDYNGSYYRVGFKLEDNSDIEMIKKASRVIKEQGNFENLMIQDNIIFEIFSYEPINADFIISIFEEFGLKIEDEFIK